MKHLRGQFHTFEHITKQTQKNSSSALYWEVGKEVYKDRLAEEGKVWDRRKRRVCNRLKKQNKVSDKCQSEARSDTSDNHECRGPEHKKLVLCSCKTATTTLLLSFWS
jgi:hypothetical protein